MREPVVLAVLLTSHNRRPATMSCLKHVEEQDPPAADLRIVLVDASSTDGTAHAVRSEHPNTLVIETDDTVYWSGGMHKAFDAARRYAPDFFLWLNDDTDLCPDAIKRLIQTCEQQTDATGRRPLVVGATNDPVNGSLTYGGVSRPSRLRPLRFEHVGPAEIPIPCDTMNGNCVLVPKEVADVCGNLDPAFTHGMGDYDYGLRASNLGFEIWVAPGFVGTCERHRSYPRRTGSLVTDIRQLMGPKGLPPLEWGTFVRRHAGRLWPIHWALTYARWLTSGLLHSEEAVGTASDERGWSVDSGL
jgi:GT2 family glycosyltransferase